jgi:hypothetical protein
MAKYFKFPPHTPWDYFMLTNAHTTVMSGRLMRAVTETSSPCSFEGIVSKFQLVFDDHTLHSEDI